MKSLENKLQEEDLNQDIFKLQPKDFIPVYGFYRYIFRPIKPGRINDRQILRGLTIICAYNTFYYFPITYALTKL